MLKIRTQFDRLDPSTKVYPGETNPGDGMRITYTSYYDSHGRLQVEPDGQVNLYEEIQSHKDSTDIHVLLDRYHQGDLEVMERLQTQRGVYADVTGMPKTYAEVLNTVHQAEQEFDRLPVEVKAKFGHSYEQWLASMDNMDTWAHRMGFDAAEEQAQDINNITPVAPDIAPSTITMSEVTPDGNS